MTRLVPLVIECFDMKKSWTWLAHSCFQHVVVSIVWSSCRWATVVAFPRFVDVIVNDCDSEEFQRRIRKPLAICASYRSCLGAAPNHLLIRWMRLLWFASGSAACSIIFSWSVRQMRFRLGPAPGVSDKKRLVFYLPNLPCLADQLIFLSVVSPSALNII